MYATKKKLSPPPAIQICLFLANDVVVENGAKWAFVSMCPTLTSEHSTQLSSNVHTLRH